MKSIYDEKGLTTEEARNFCDTIEEVVEPVFKEYIEKGFSFRELSHEAQSAIRDLELEVVMDLYYQKVDKGDKI